MLYDTCPNCFGAVEPDGVCAACGYDQNKARKFDGVIKPMNILNARYLTGRVLGRGGFGITYLAKDMATGRKVAIKECMPESYSYRAGDAMIFPKQEQEYAFDQCKKNFREETGALFELRNNPFVVNVSDYFSENNTEYFVMEYIDGVSVKFLTQRQNGKISLENATLILLTVGSALIEIHKKGIIHRDISPENIMVTRDGNVKLIDFGAAKYYLHSTAIDNESIFLKPGFAPPEQYSNDGKQGPWTDVYALAATFYTIVSGQPLVDSTYRLKEDNMKTLLELECDVPEFVSDAVKKALAPEVHDRYASVMDFLDDVSEISTNASQIDEGTLSLVSQQKAKEDKVGRIESLRNGVKTPCVEVVSGKHRGSQLRIPDYGFICLGRSDELSDILVDDYEEISRQHCLVGYDRSKNRFIVIDRSSNGTFFSNGRRMLYNAESFIGCNEEFFIYSSNLRIKVKLI